MYAYFVLTKISNETLRVELVLPGVKFVRYCQNLSRRTMFNFKKLTQMTIEDMARFNGVLEAAKSIEISPVMVIRHLLKLEGLNKREVKETIEGTLSPPEYLKDSLDKALRNDPVFSPKGIQYSKKRGSLGEDLIAEWIDSRYTVEYTRDVGQGGPDLHFETPIQVDIDGRLKTIDWIESKASYADSFEVRRNRAQFNRYRELGKGLIFYWYGIEASLEWDVFIWKDVFKRVDPSLKKKIKAFIAFVPPEFRFLIFR